MCQRTCRRWELNSAFAAARRSRGARAGAPAPDRCASPRGWRRGSRRGAWWRRAAGASYAKQCGRSPLVINAPAPARHAPRSGTAAPVPACRWREGRLLFSETALDWRWIALARSSFAYTAPHPMWLRQHDPRTRVDARRHATARTPRVRAGPALARFDSNASFRVVPRCTVGMRASTCARRCEQTVCAAAIAGDDAAVSAAIAAVTGAAAAATGETGQPLSA